jgi:hypothetical protein
MKDIYFNLKISFSEEITNNEIEEIADNIKKTIINQVINDGLAPIDSSAFTTDFSITSIMNNIEINYNF